MTAIHSKREQFILSYPQYQLFTAREKILLMTAHAFNLQFDIEYVNK